MRTQVVKESLNMTENTKNRGFKKENVTLYPTNTKNLYTNIQIAIMKKATKMDKSFWKDKRGVEVWVSWVMMLVLIIGLATLMMGWMKSYSQSSMDEVEKRVYDADLCGQISISMDYAVCKDIDTMEVQLTNRNNFRISQVLFRAYYNISDPNMTEVNVTLKPGDTKKVNFEVIPRNFDDLIWLEAIPVHWQITDERVSYICRNRLISKNMSKEASCQ